jgi:hypothetical protein
VIHMVICIRVWDLMSYPRSLVDSEHCFVGTCNLRCSVKRFHALARVCRAKGHVIPEDCSVKFYCREASVTFIQLLVLLCFISGLRAYF